MFKRAVLNFINTILEVRFIFSGPNPHFTVFHHQFLSTYYHDKWLIDKMQNLSGSILDFGCGNKPYKDFLKVSSYIGADLASNTKADLHVIEGYKLALVDDSVDGIVSTQVLEHVSDPDLVIKEWKRILKNGSVILVTIPFMYGAHGLPFDFRRFTKEGITSLFLKEGFILMDSKQFGGIGSYLVLGIQNWIEGHPGKLFLLLRLCLSPIYPVYTLVLNLIGLAFNKIDTNSSFYTNAGVLLRYEK